MRHSSANDVELGIWTCGGKKNMIWKTFEFSRNTRSWHHWIFVQLLMEIILKQLRTESISMQISTNQVALNSYWNEWFLNYLKKLRNTKMQTLLNLSIMGKLDRPVKSVFPAQAGCISYFCISLKSNFMLTNRWKEILVYLEMSTHLLSNMQLQRSFICSCFKICLCQNFATLTGQVQGYTFTHTT